MHHNLDRYWPRLDLRALAFGVLYFAGLILFLAFLVYLFAMGQASEVGR